MLQALQGPRPNIGAERQQVKPDIDTGKAAVIAYSNLQIPESENTKDENLEKEWRLSPQTRNSLMAHSGDDVPSSVTSTGNLSAKQQQQNAQNNQQSNPLGNPQNNRQVKSHTAFTANQNVVTAGVRQGGTQGADTYVNSRRRLLVGGQVGTGNKQGNEGRARSLQPNELTENILEDDEATALIEHDHTPDEESFLWQHKATSNSAEQT